MPRNYHTKIGDRFGSRVITGFLRERDSDGHLRCTWKCDCGAEGAAGLKAFRHALKCPRCVIRYDRGSPKHGHAGTKYNPRTKLYDAWANMMQRTNPASAGPRNRRWYSDRGITVCAAWRTFEGFRDWAIANGWQPGLSLDRIRTCWNYEPGNCEWVTRAENSRRSVEDRWRNHSSTPLEMFFGTGG